MVSYMMEKREIKGNEESQTSKEGQTALIEPTPTPSSAQHFAGPHTRVPDGFKHALGGGI